RTYNSLTLFTSRRRTHPTPTLFPYTTLFRSVIKQTQIKSDNTMITVEVTAKHIFMEFQNHYILKDLENEEVNNEESEDEDKPSYTLEQYLQFGFNGNKLGFTYQIVGDFNKRVIIDELG